MNISIRIGRRYLFAKRRQTFISLITIISITGVATGVMSLIIALAISSGFSERIKDKIQLMNAHLTIASMVKGGFTEDEIKKIRDTVLKHKEVSGFAPLHLGVAMITGGGGHPSFIEVAGINEDVQKGVVPLDKIIYKGKYGLKTKDGNEGIIIGESLAESLSVNLGDDVSLLVPKTTLSPFGALPSVGIFKITGIIKSDYYLFDTSYAYIDIKRFKSIYKEQKEANVLQIRLRNISQIEKMKHLLSDELDGCRILDLIEQNKDFFSALKMEKIILILTISLIVLVAALNIISTLILMVMEKTKDVGILRAMGATNKEIMGVFMVQGTTIGVIGTAMGAILGITISYCLDHFRMIALSTHVYPLPYVPFIIHYEHVLFVCLFSIIISFIATLYPSLRASTLSPVDALRYE